MRDDGAALGSPHHDHPPTDRAGQRRRDHPVVVLQGQAHRDPLHPYRPAPRAQPGARRRRVATREARRRRTRRERTISRVPGQRPATAATAAPTGPWRGVGPRSAQHATRRRLGRSRRAGSPSSRPPAWPPPIPGASPISSTSDGPRHRHGRESTSARTGTAGIEVPCAGHDDAQQRRQPGPRAPRLVAPAGRTGT